MGEKMLPQSIRQLMPEAEAYMQIVQLEKRMDQIILRKRLAMQEAIKKPIKVRPCLRFLSLPFPSFWILLSLADQTQAQDHAEQHLHPGQRRGEAAT